MGNSVTLLFFRKFHKLFLKKKWGNTMKIKQNNRLNTLYLSMMQWVAYLAIIDLLGAKKILSMEQTMKFCLNFMQTKATWNCLVALTVVCAVLLLTQTK
ncbi:hypothetical protein CYK10_07870 [Streptococcus anginosus]|jgi:hypothetical protein|nr:hypothetical protein CYK10_07870 [Streptococcus anginosus]